MTNAQDIKSLFKDTSLIEKALTHRSWINENPGVRESNERLEFLGDAILEFVVSSHIYKEFPKEEEGFLTALRANIVNTKSLGNLAVTLGIGEILLLSKGEEQGGGRTNQSLLADTVEAIIGGLYIDQGFDAASNFIHENLLTDLSRFLEKPLKDAKSRLQELVQSKGLATPKYKVVNESGPDHAKSFVVEVYVAEETYGSGEGRSKSTAEQSAAENALEKLDQKA